MKYIAPQYANELVMSNDIITDSIVATTTHTNGVVENTVNVYNDETGVYEGQKSSFELAIDKFYPSNN